MDCDFQHLLLEIRNLFDPAAEGYEVVVGSHFSRYGVLLKDTFSKIISNRAFHLLVPLFLLCHFRVLTKNLN